MIGTTYLLMIIYLHFGSDPMYVCLTQLFRDQLLKMPTGYDKEEVEQIVKKKRNVDSNALSLTNIAVKCYCNHMLYSW